MKVIDAILNEKYNKKSAKEEIIAYCCTDSFGINGTCLDGSGNCEECWSRNIEDIDEESIVDKIQ